MLAIVVSSFIYSSFVVCCMFNFFALSFLLCVLHAVGSVQSVVCIALYLFRPVVIRGRSGSFTIRLVSLVVWFFLSDCCFSLWCRFISICSVSYRIVRWAICLRVCFYTCLCVVVWRVYSSQLGVFSVDFTCSLSLSVDFYILDALLFVEGDCFSRFTMFLITWCVCFLLSISFCSSTLVSRTMFRFVLFWSIFRHCVSVGVHARAFWLERMVRFLIWILDDSIRFS